MLKSETQKKRAVKTRPFGREAGILAEKRPKCVIFKENQARFPVNLLTHPGRPKANCGCKHGVVGKAPGRLILPQQPDPFATPSLGGPWPAKHRYRA